MSGFARLIICATAFCALTFVASRSAEALTNGATSLPSIEATVLVRRERIAWRRRPDGTTQCTPIGARARRPSADPARGDQCPAICLPMLARSVSLTARRS